jgi:hypothetical protein
MSRSVSSTTISVSCFCHKPPSVPAISGETTAVVTESAAEKQRTKENHVSHNTQHANVALTRRTALSGVGMAAAALGLSQVSAVTAQEATPSTMASHPIVGVWLNMNATVPPSPSVSIYGADGSFVSVSPVNYKDTERGVVYASDLIGTWEPTGPRSIHLTGISMESDENAAFTGTFTLDGYPEVSEDGQTWADDGTQVKATLRDATNAVVAVIGGGGDQPPITPPVIATRMSPGPLVFPPTPQTPGNFPGAAGATPAQ